MKKTSILTAIITLALAGFAKAQSITANQADLIISFRVSDQVDLSGGISGNGTENLEIDLGPAANFLSNNYTFNLGPDLVALFGSSWNTASTLYWSVAASQGTTSSNILWATSPGNQATFSRQSGSLQNTTRGYIDGVRGGLNGSTSTGLGLNAAIIAASQSTSYTTEVTKGSTSYYGYTKFNSGIESGVSNTGAVTADLYYIPSGSGAGTDWGTFSLATNGSLTYAAVVPEPSTYTSLGVGAAFVLLARPRRRKSIPI